jgi:hypothetical protein
MPLTTRTIHAIDQLLTDGEASDTDLSELSEGASLGLWAPSFDGKSVVATAAVVQLLQTLPSQSEAIAAILAADPTLRQSWQGIVAARLQELGGRRNAQDLCNAIDTLGQSASSLLTQLPQASLTPTGYSELERIVLEAPAEQATATPKLIRILGAIAPLIEGGQGKPASMLPLVDDKDPSRNWIKGRLLRLPDGATVDKKPEFGWTPSSILTGSLADYQPIKKEVEKAETMYWVLARPWCFLLAQIVFTQEAWAAERIAGGLTLELDPGNVPQALQPPKVTVVVTNAAGEETICGSLAELVLRVLEQLSVTLLAADLTHLDRSLAPVISALLQRQVWQFDLGSSLRRPSYIIHPAFSDDCYRALGSRYFNRLASSVTASIRSTGERWAIERRAQNPITLTR